MLRSCNICMDIMTKYLSNMSLSGDNSNLEEKTDSLKCLASVFAKYGGVLGKIAQVLSFENENSNVFSESKPFSSKKTHKYATLELFKTEKFKDLEMENKIFKNGSLGQVYKGTMAGKNIILKVQYCGLDQQAQEDFSIINMIIKFLYSTNTLENAVKDIKDKMQEELNYENEKANQIKFAELYKDSSDIVIPSIIGNLCDTKTVVMEFMDGFTDMTSFISNSTQETRNKIGNIMLKFTFENIYKHNLFYSDNHYGNFLVKDEKLCVLDFGCVSIIEDPLLSALKNIHKYLYENDKDNFVKTMKTAGILNEETSKISVDYCYDFFKLQYRPLLDDDFIITDEWVDTVGEKDVLKMKEWSLPPHWIYLHKIPYGLYHILGKMNMKTNCSKYLYETYCK